MDIRSHSVGQLSSLFEGQPIQFGQVLALRAAMRVVPFIAEFDRYSVLTLDRRAELYLATFRTLHGAWTALYYPEGDLFPAVAATARVTARIAGQVATTTGAATVAKASYSSADAALAVGREDIQLAARSLQSAIDVSTAALPSSKEEFWHQINADADDLQRQVEKYGYVDFRTVLEKKIWRQRQPTWAKRALANFTKAVNSTGGNWAFWLEWYSSRLRGIKNFGLTEPAARQLHTQILHQDESWWENGHILPNSTLAHWLEEARENDSSPTIKEFILQYLDQQPSPVTVRQILDAFTEASFSVIPKTVRSELSRLSAAKLITRVETGLYSRQSETTSFLPVEGIPTPFEYGWSSEGLITVIGGGMNSFSVPPARSSHDAHQRLSAAKTLADDLATELEGGSFQARSTYSRSLRRYSERLPCGLNGNIYLADAEARTIRTEFNSDIDDYIDPRLAARLKTFLEQHQGLRIYFPELTTFYEDVRTGSISTPLPLDEMDALENVVRQFTPDVFHNSVEETLAELQQADLADSSKSQPNTPEPNEIISPPPDPIADIDPVRVTQHARGGALNSIWALLQKGEAGAKNIERFEKAYASYARYVAALVRWLGGIG